VDPVDLRADIRFSGDLFERSQLIARKKQAHTPLQFSGIGIPFDIGVPLIRVGADDRSAAQVIAGGKLFQCGPVDQRSVNNGCVIMTAQVFG
jgi:hypothetical protein